MCDLDRTTLPTRRHVIEYLLFVWHKGAPNIHKNQKLIVYANNVSREIVDLRQRTKIPIFTENRVQKLILNFFKSFKDITMLFHKDTFKQMHLI